eukprot:g14962.t1
MPPPPPRSSIFVMRNGRYEPQNLMPVMPRPDVLDFDGFVLRRAANRVPVRPPDLRQASLVKSSVSLRKATVQARPAVSSSPCGGEGPFDDGPIVITFVYDALRAGQLSLYLRVTEVEHNETEPGGPVRRRVELVQPLAPSAVSAGSGDQSGQVTAVPLHEIHFEKGLGQARRTAGTGQLRSSGEACHNQVLDVQKRGGSYDHAADFWGLGAVLFVMLCGRYPFDGQKQALDEQIRTASYCMSGSRWRGISEAAKSLVRGLLRVNPVDRLSLEECLKHPWVLGQPLPPKTRLEPPVKWELAGEGRHGMAAISENCAEVPKQDARGQKVSSPSSPEDATGTAACSVKGSGFNLAPLLAFFLGRKDFRCGRWRLALVLVLAFAFWGWRSPREKLVAGEGMPLMGRTNVPNALEKPSHFNNLSVEGDEQKLLAAMDVQTPFFYMAGLDPPTDQLLLEASTKDPYQHSLFRLSELLKLQISIVGSLEFANMAVRNVDAELAESTRSAYQQARNLFKQAAEVVARYAEMAQQVSNTVLPDLQLAVDEQEPALAESMLEMLKNWVTDMKKDSNVIRANYGALQNTIGSLADRAQQSKQQADEITEVSDATEEPSSWVNLEDSVSTWLPSSSSEFNRFNSSDMALAPRSEILLSESAIVAVRCARGFKDRRCLTERVHTTFAQAAQWEWVSLASWAYIMATIMMLYKVIPLFINVLLAWLNSVVAHLPFAGILGFTFGAGMVLFMLPPVPGPPIYLFGGLVISEHCPYGFWRLS